MNYAEKWLPDVKQQMRIIAEHPYKETLVGKVLDDALDTNGKMVRARLLILAASLGPKMQERKDRIVMLAAMVELTHLASLIHDDIIDESDFRRGKASIQSKYSKDAAVYAGDFLMARIKYYEAKEKLNAASMLLSKAIEDMCTGEIGQAICRYKAETTMQQYLANINGKTVALFKTACLMGSKEAGADKKTVGILEEIGELLGYMFQLRDDLLDFTQDTYHLGKEAHKDFREGIYTLPVLAALEKDESGKLSELMQKNAKKALSDAEISQAEQLVIKLGGVDYTKAKIKECSDKIQVLLKELPKADTTTLLKKLVKNLEEK